MGKDGQLPISPSLGVLPEQPLLASAAFPAIPQGRRDVLPRMTSLVKMKQWLWRLAKIVPTKTCQCKLSGQVLPCCGSLPKFRSWSMSMASVELHSYMIIVFLLSEWITILAKAVRWPWILSGLKGYGSWKANISNRQKHNKTENQQSSTKDTRWGIRCVSRQTLVGLSCDFQETTNLEMITPMSDIVRSLSQIWS